MDKHVLIRYIEEVFGEYKEAQSTEIIIDCPVCAAENNGIKDGKKNLSLNHVLEKYKCWKCEYKGSLGYLFFKHADRDVYKRFKEETFTMANVDSFLYDDLGSLSPNPIFTTTKLPDEYVPLYNCDLNNIRYKEAWDYCIGRGLTKRDIEKFNIGVCLYGYYRDRLIFPSYNDRGEVNFFVTRAYNGRKPDYLLCKNNKLHIVFNESNINWDSPVFIVEGVFDMVVIPNSTPILGKIIPYELVNKLLYYKTPVVLMMDPDAYEKSNTIATELHNLGLKVKIAVWGDSDNDISKIHLDKGKNKIIELINNTTNNLDIISYIL